LLTEGQCGERCGLGWRKITLRHFEACAPVRAFDVHAYQRHGANGHDHEAWRVRDVEMHHLRSLGHVARDRRPAMLTAVETPISRRNVGNVSRKHFAHHRASHQLLMTAGLELHAGYPRVFVRGQHLRKRFQQTRIAQKRITREPQVDA
jgi:hypothetical protein